VEQAAVGQAVDKMFEGQSSVSEMAVGQKSRFSNSKLNSFEVDESKRFWSRSSARSEPTVQIRGAGRAGETGRSILNKENRLPETNCSVNTIRGQTFEFKMVGRNYF
jgi:hypothetical protein